MKKLIVAVCCVMMFAGCGDDDTAEPNLVTIRMIETAEADLFDKTVLLYEDDEYVISTYFDKYISEYPFDVLFGYEELRLQATQDTLAQDTLLMQEYIKYNGDDVFTLAHHLENGSCLIYDKTSAQVVSTIQMEKYGFDDPTTAVAGRRFFIKKKKLFLETGDLIR